MTQTNLIAEESIDIDAPPARVWDALVKPELIKQYMMGADVTSDWREGSSIVWKGEWKGKSFEDKGMVLQAKPEQLLQYTHFSPMEGKPELPENTHIVTITLTPKGDQTHLSLEQDHNASEQARDESTRNWAQMLAALKKVAEA